MLVVQCRCEFNILSNSGWMKTDLTAIGNFRKNLKQTANGLLAFSLNTGFLSSSLFLSGSHGTLPNTRDAENKTVPQSCIKKLFYFKSQFLFSTTKKQSIPIRLKKQKQHGIIKNHLINTIAYT